MSSNVMTTTDLIRCVKVRASVPTNQITFVDQDIIDILNQELNNIVVRILLSVHEEYLVTYEDQLYNTNQTDYIIPYRSIVNKIREVSIIDSPGNTFELSRIKLTDLPDFQKSFSFDQRNIFYIKNNYIIIPNNIIINVDASRVRCWFYLRPNKLVLNSGCATISNIDQTTGIISVNAIPSTFTSMPSFDFVAFNSPNKLYSYDLQAGVVNSLNNTLTFPVPLNVASVNLLSSSMTIPGHGFYTGCTVSVTSPNGTIPTALQSGGTTVLNGTNKGSITNAYFAINVDTNTVQFATSLVNARNGVFIPLTDTGTGSLIVAPTINHISSEIQIGDYINVNGETIVPQLPMEMHSLLVERAALVCIESVGDAQEVNLMRAKLKEMEKSMMDLLDNRTEGSPRKINPRNSIMKNSKIMRSGLRRYSN